MRKPTPHPSGAKPPKLSKNVIPNHVAVVMDGNGRWAKQRGLPRTAGHEAGEAALFDLVEGAIEIGVKEISAFAFSTENWKREDSEIKYLMKMPELLYKIWQKNFKDHDVKFKIIGQKSELNPNVQKTIQKIEIKLHQY